MARSMKTSLIKRLIKNKGHVKPYITRDIFNVFMNRVLQCSKKFKYKYTCDRLYYTIYWERERFHGLHNIE
ncbi:hypothetical protein J8TS2_37030 [Lederbergia ruris]|uniref:Uncharacterized protein n=1 Tax=Lederbergia ruris TaxID=217495 RepID=A0ABQ4KPD4_9BACI|nr:hypothetical protein J8TS2_37030 [Lederbergia ruris]